MPRGAPVVDTGILLRSTGLILERDAGGTWRLDVHRVPLDLLGSHVRIIGKRSGHDLVDVERIERC
jgi:hypothetical protein